MNKRALNRIIALLFLFGLFFTAVVEGTVRSARAERSGRSPGEAFSMPARKAAAQGGERESGGGAPEGGASAAPGTVGPGTGYLAEEDLSRSVYEEFLDKFQATETALEKLKEKNREDRTGLARKNEASAELRYWETQLNSLYQTIMEKLSDEEAAIFAVNQQEWRKRRDTGAARSAAGSPKESSEYIFSQANETRERAYALLSQYRDKLE